ncbi:transmembrane protein 126A [Elysia marginata]|uniref:Transmembrane protein 126A n=1 Tax=Elysia marginata TaxID=1093978 RepID=A0AAV4JWK0_9GAST|nr:transmembrane protein 126A [Elysia marginata]
MEQQPVKMRGEAVLLRKGDKIPANALPLTDAEVLSIQTRRINTFQPQKDVRVYLYSNYAISATTGLSGLAIANVMRRNFRLGGLRRMLTYGPTVVIAGLCAGVMQEIFIKRQILLGKEACPTCTAVKGGCFQMGMGVVYPYILSLLTCIPTARDYYTLQLPGRGSGGNSYLQLLRQVTPKSSYLLGLVVLNIYMGAFVATRQLQVFAKHLSQPPTRMQEFLKENREMLE